MSHASVISKLETGFHLRRIPWGFNADHQPVSKSTRRQRSSPAPSAICRWVTRLLQCCMAARVFYPWLQVGGKWDVREDALVRGSILSSYITYDVSHQLLVETAKETPVSHGLQLQSLCMIPVAAVS